MVNRLQVKGIAPCTPGKSRGSTPKRSIRVFISSTFRDMHGERDELVKRVFPVIRKLCESRGVAWAEVDLRWGVTEEQKAEGNVLAVCLSEIQNCRPFFIGLIGERYGWVPAEIPPNLIEIEPWLGGYEGHSVTDLEILHGVLNNPAMAGHAFFYLRDPAFTDRLPRGVNRADFACEGPESAEKLARLKDRIRSSGFPVREGYRDPRELSDFVLSDLRDTLDSLFPEGSEPDPLDREWAEHDAFARSRSQIYVPRPADFQALDDHAEGGGGPLVVLGESGSGKSALLANWALRRRERDPGKVLLMHFVGATPESSDLGSILRRLVGELKRRCDLPGEIPDRSDRLQAEFGDWLVAAAEKTRVVMVLDALNQVEDRDGASDLAWLPESLPAGVRVIVSTLPGRVLDEGARRRWSSLVVEPLRAEERGSCRRLPRPLFQGAEPGACPPHRRVRGNGQPALSPRCWRSCGSSAFTSDLMSGWPTTSRRRLRKTSTLGSFPVTRPTTKRTGPAWSATRCRCCGRPAAASARSSCSNSSAATAFLFLAPIGLLSRSPPSRFWSTARG